MPSQSIRGQPDIILRKLNPPALLPPRSLTEKQPDQQQFWQQARNGNGQICSNFFRQSMLLFRTLESIDLEDPVDGKNQRHNDHAPRITAPREVIKWFNGEQDAVFRVMMVRSDDMISTDRCNISG